MIEAHKLWVSSEGMEGKQADLSGLDLTGARLDDREFSGADFSEAMLQNASFTEARMVGTRLDGTNALGASFAAAEPAFGEVAAGRREGDVVVAGNHCTGRVGNGVNDAVIRRECQKLECRYREVDHDRTVAERDRPGDLVRRADQQPVIGLLRGLPAIGEGGERNRRPAGCDQQDERAGEPQGKRC